MPDILHRVGIDARPEQVFNALATIKGVRGWWSNTAAGDAEMGGVINYGFCDMQVIATEPNKHAHWREPVEFMHHCSTKWATFLLSLRDLVEKSEGRPLPDALKIAVNG